MDLHRFRHGFGTDDQSDREGKAMGPRRTRTQYSGSLNCDPVTHSFALEFSLPIVEFAIVLPILCVSCHFILSRLCMYYYINYVSSSLHAMGLTRKISFADLSLTSELFFIFKDLSF